MDFGHARSFHPKYCRVHCLCKFGCEKIQFIYDKTIGEEALIYALGQGEISHIVTNGASLKTIAKVKKSGVNTISNVIYTDTATNEDLELCKSLNIKVWPFKDIEELVRRKI